MNQTSRHPLRCAILGMAAAIWLAASTPGFALTYYLVDGGAGWPDDIRNRIISSMDEAVATYNANGYFNVNVRVYYHPGIPTAQSDYNGQLGFGGSISARVAMHEISHYLGTGTHGAWGANRPNGYWAGAASSHFIQLFDGPGARINGDNFHYWPYGLNYDSEDSPQNRIREVKLVSAMRFDMGIVGDGDGDGLPDEWEMYRFGNNFSTCWVRPIRTRLSTMSHRASSPTGLLRNTSSMEMAATTAAAICTG